MSLGEFIREFYSNSSARTRAFQNAANTGNTTLVNDLAFLSAVHKWRNGKHGKKNCVQIQITFCIRVRGGGTANPFAISTTAIQPPTHGLKAINDTVLSLRNMDTGALAQSKALDKKMAVAKEDGTGFGSFKAFCFGAYKKCSAAKRTISADVFEQAVAEVEAPGGVIDQWVAGGGGTGAVWDLNNAAMGMAKHFADLRRLLAEGGAGGHLDLTGTGLHAV